MKFSLVVAAAAASQVSIRNLYKLSAKGLASGATCTPPTGNAADPCDTGLACTGAKNSGANEGTKSCASSSLAQKRGLASGATCTPPGENGTNPCDTGLACTGAKNSGANEGTKSCASSSLASGLASGATCTPPGENGTN